MWFEGAIESAIAKSKSEKRLLIIFISGKDEKSRTVFDYWAVDEIRDLVVRHSCVALNLAEGSEAAQQFGQYYPVTCIPICFFISPKGGIPLEILVAYDSLDSFKERLIKTIESFRNSMASESDHQGSSQSVISATSSPIDQPEKSIADNSDGAGTSANLQDRLNKAQALIKERQDQKSREQQEKALAEELKRRQDGQQFQSAQERIKQAEALQNANDQKKAKKDDKEYLMKLREQIAADRAEKNAKFAVVQNDQKKEVENKKQQKVEVDERKQKEEEDQRKRFAVIQFRLPDGSSKRHQFDGGAVFAEAEHWIAGEISLAVSTFLLVQMMPRREFSAEDRKRSFSELGLTPNAALMVLPNVSAGARPQQGGSSTMARVLSVIWNSITSPVLYIYNIVYAFVFGPTPTAPIGAATATGNTQSQDQRPSTSTGSNVTHFKNAQDDKKKDDENATYNGNSTQQL